MNIDIHVYKTRDGKWDARITYGKQGRMNMGRSDNLEILMLQVKRALLLLNTDTQ
jgi:hypothetical protein